MLYTSYFILYLTSLWPFIHHTLLGCPNAEGGACMFPHRFISSKLRLNCVFLGFFSKQGTERALLYCSYQCVFNTKLSLMTYYSLVGKSRLQVTVLSAHTHTHSIVRLAVRSNTAFVFTHEGPTVRQAALCSLVYFCWKPSLCRVPHITASERVMWLHMTVNTIHTFIPKNSMHCYKWITVPKGTLRRVVGGCKALPGFLHKFSRKKKQNNQDDYLDNTYYDCKKKKQIKPRRQAAGRCSSRL